MCGQSSKNYDSESDNYSEIDEDVISSSSAAKTSDVENE
jgi:hypothetical protein